MLVLALDTSTPLITVTVARVDGDPSGPTISLLSHAEEDNPFAHAEQLMPLTKAAMAEAGCTLTELGAIVVGIGPGPFTGLRVGIATAAGLGDGLGIPVYPVPSHEGFASATSPLSASKHSTPQDTAPQDATPQDTAPQDTAPQDSTPQDTAPQDTTPQLPGLTAEPFLVVTDARRKEVFVTGFTGTAAVLGPVALAPAALTEFLAESDFRPVYLIGPGAALVSDNLSLPIRIVEEDLGLGLIRAAASEVLSAGSPAPLTPLYLRRPDAVEPSKVRKSVLGR